MPGRSPLLGRRLPVVDGMTCTSVSRISAPAARACARCASPCASSARGVPARTDTTPKPHQWPACSDPACPAARQRPRSLGPPPRGRVERDGLGSATPRHRSRVEHRPSDHPKSADRRGLPRRALQPTSPHSCRSPRCSHATRPGRSIETLGVFGEPDQGFSRPESGSDATRPPLRPCFEVPIQTPHPPIRAHVVAHAQVPVRLRPCALPKDLAVSHQRKRVHGRGQPRSSRSVRTAHPNTTGESTARLASGAPLAKSSNPVRSHVLLT